MATAAMREVGRIMVNFAELEWELAGGIGRLIGPELPGEQMVALEVPFAKKCALFDRLCQQKLAHARRNVRAELKALMPQLLQCEGSRSQATHPLWLRRAPDQHLTAPLLGGSKAVTLVRAETG
jgi:hypothetical protein